MPAAMDVLDFEQAVRRLSGRREDYQSRYLAMYSSWYRGIVTDPCLMMVPIDDHLVHRGDGVFEALKCVAGNLYLLDRHLDRLESSAAVLQLVLPLSRRELVSVVLRTVRVAGVREAMIRIFVSRGPGGFTTNPYECPESQLYVVVTELKKVAAERYQRGIKVKTSRVPIKSSFFANVKSCNYLPNVLMNKEAVDCGVDFTVAMDENGYLAESSTANLGIVTEDRALLVPRFDRTLRGTTLVRALELAQSLVAAGELAKIDETKVTREQAYRAREIMLFGTTLDVLPVVDFDGQSIGDGRPGPIFRRLLAMIQQDQRSGQGVLTPVGQG